ncbi:8719_t:CDS:2, partial [Racocetra fulgida]
SDEMIYNDIAKRKRIQIFDRIRITRNVQDENDCPAPIRFIKEVAKVIKESGKEKVDPYDTTYFKKGLESYCDQPFNCDPRTAEKYWTKIEHVCAKELSYKVDWSVDPNPNPVLSLDSKYIFKSDGTKIPIPKKLHCDEKCYETIAKMYKSWIKHYKLSPKVAENLFGSEDGFIEYLSCKADDKRDVIRRTS